MSGLIFCLMGPTASGKTDLAALLAQRFPFEVISVDSAMIYREMDIGTAKPNADELAQTPHHLIDIVDPIDAYSAAQFCADASRLSKDILAKGKLPLLVGGTMMYFNALQKGLSTLPEADEQIREKIEKEAQEKGWAALHQRLQGIDPKTAARIHPNDTQRISRALEVYALTGKPLSECLEQRPESEGFDFVNLVLFPQDRAWLHQRIAQRFEQMLAQGLIEEVEGLLKKWSLSPEMPALRSVGYRQVYDYLQGDRDLQSLKDKGIAATRQLAKRQLTWLRQWPEAIYFDPKDPDLLDKVVAKIKKIPL